MGEVRIALQSLKMSFSTRMQYRVDSLVAALAVWSFYESWQVYALNLTASTVGM